jgi:HD-GYP domain-containing protein (c-di-GMP phosphodiesterase class II)
MTTKAILLEAAPKDAVGGASYIRVPLENLPAGRPLPFRLYHSIEGEYILYCGDGKVLKKEERDRLLQNHLTELYIARDDLPRYRDYMDRFLAELLVARDLPIEQKVETFYSLAAGIGTEVMAAPQKPESIASASDVVRVAIALLEGGKEVIHRLMALMGGQYDLVTHSINATNYGLALARVVGVREPRALLNLGLGLFLHDVGLRLLPQSLIQRKGLLSTEERAVLKRHPLLGVELFLPGKHLEESTLAVIRDHHERCDGSGYPHGVGADKLSLEARIAQIATAFDFLTTNNPSRRAVSSYEAVRSMSREQPGAFDQELLRNFIELIGEGRTGPGPKGA